MKTAAPQPILPIAWTRRIVPLALALLPVLVDACSDNWKLIGYGPGFMSDGEWGGGGWHVYKEAHAPTGPVEEAVVKVAQTGKSLDLPDEQVLFILKDRAFGYVYAVDKNGETGWSDWLSRKSFVRFIVVQDKIVAKSDQVTEPLGDAEFERAVLIDASMAKSMDSVLLYQDKAHPASLSSRPLGSCAAEVRVFKADQIGGMPLANKIVSYCALRFLKEPHG